MNMNDAITKIISVQYQIYDDLPSDDEFMNVVNNVTFNGCDANAEFDYDAFISRARFCLHRR